MSTFTPDLGAVRHTDRQVEASAEAGRPLVTDDQRPYRPYGACEELFYDRRPLVGLDGPAGTGKSRGALEKLHLILEKYPGARGVILRKTRESLSESALFTLEERVIPRGHPTLRGEQRRNYRQHYLYPNGSELVVGGLDKPQKVMSTEYDVAYVQEVTECEEGDLELVSTRLRNGVVPYQQLLFDCNPDRPTHWVWQRHLAGTLPLLHSRHEDNPTLYDQATGTWTPHGLAYLATLDALTGARKQRLRYGRWVQAEGVVYEAWDRAFHVLTVEECVARGVLLPDLDPRTGRPAFDRAHVHRVLGSVDWGFTNPGVALVAGEADDGCLYVLRQVYQTQRDVDWWVPTFARLHADYGVERWVADPSEPAYVTRCRRDGLPMELGLNAVAPGVSAVQARLQRRPDGRARLYFVEGSLPSDERDPSLTTRYKPACTEDEFDGYVWQTTLDGRPLKEVPVKVHDHGLDTLRYLVARCDLQRRRVGRVSGRARPA